MGQFQVTGTNSSGKESKVYVEADSPKSARLKARTQGLIPISVVAVDAAQIAKSVSEM